MSELPASWTCLPGMIAGCLYLGRIGRWLQIVHTTMGKGPASWGPDPHPRRWKIVLSLVAYPTPWIAVGIAAWGVHHAVVAPLTAEWTWFYAGFFGGPAALLLWVYVKVRQVRRKATLLAPKH